MIQWVRSIKRFDFDGAFIAFVLLCPIASLFEQTVRGDTHLLFFHDLVLPGLLVLGAAFVIVLYNHGIPALTVAVALLAAGFVARKRWPDGGPVSRVLAATWLVLPRVFVFSLCLTAWAWFADWQTGAAVAAVALVLVVARVNQRLLRVLKTEYGMLPLGLLAGLGLIAFSVLYSAGAVTEVAARPYTGAVYDAVADPAGTLAVATRGRDGFLLRDGQFRYVDNVHRAQRIAFDAASGLFYFANYLGRDDGALAVADSRDDWPLPVPDCNRAIDVAVTADRLFVVCEYSHRFFALRSAGGAVLADWPLSLLPYGVTVDRRRRQVDTIDQFGPLRTFDTDGRFLDSHLIGLGNFGIAVDEATGVVWVARYLTGEVIALNPAGKIVARVRVGCGPRDLAVDAQRRLLLVGDYISGTVSVVDLDRHAAVDRLRFGERSLLPRLRGVTVTPGGGWLISQSTGVYQYIPK